MPSKPVVQNTCERCTRVWYTEKAVEVKLELKAELTGKKFEAKYECLCDGCTKTVASLLNSIAKEFKPRAPRAKKKDESADQGKPQSTDPSPTPGAAPEASPPIAVVGSFAASNADGVGRRPSLPAAAPQRPR